MSRKDSKATNSMANERACMCIIVCAVQPTASIIHGGEWNVHVQTCAATGVREGTNLAGDLKNWIIPNAY